MMKMRETFPSKSVEMSLSLSATSSFFPVLLCLIYGPGVLTPLSGVEGCTVRIVELFHKLEVEDPFFFSNNYKEESDKSVAGTGRLQDMKLGKS